MAMTGSAPGDSPLTFGVEEEFLLADTRSRAAAPRAAEVIADVRPVLGQRVQGEFFASQLEIRTDPASTSADLRAQLAAGRQAVAAAAARHDCLLVASATALLTRHPLPITDAPRYREIARHVGPLATGAGGGELSGLHVHLGTFDRAEALRLSHRLRPWLPVLQALMVNSPFADGRDRNCASWRALQYGQWPTVGPAPVLDERGYDALADRLVTDGTVLDRRMIYWYARPSEHLPTLEIRVADVNADLDATLLFAVLLRGLASSLLYEAERDAPAPDVTDAQLAAAHRQAALHGLRGTGVDPSGTSRPMIQLLHLLLRRSTPGLEAHGDLAEARALLGAVLATGTGAERQRVFHRRHGSLHHVVDGLAALTARA
ncbi:YbdK family carboxylate-amine ligase [Kitasatospora sp. NPDC059973]|uniref:carboxylate-amine ligase n=1 Tax=Kitasatospora sp. NPDC059973 TaxID=3347020 RepID=UPI00368B5850